jgi:hypothetical protein
VPYIVQGEPSFERFRSGHTASFALSIE